MQGPADQGEPNPELARLLGTRWVVGAFLEPFAEDPPEIEVYDAAAGEAATARVQAKAAAMRNALQWGVDALAELNDDMMRPHERLIVEGANQYQMEGSLHLTHRLYRDVLHAIVKAHNEWHAHNRGHFFPDTEDSGPEDGALVAAQHMLRHESDTVTESTVGTHIYTPTPEASEASDEDMYA